MSEGMAAGGQNLRIVLSLLAAAAGGVIVFLLLEVVLRAPGAQGRSAALFTFQLSSMLAMAVFAGLAIAVYVRLARSAAVNSRTKSRTKSRINSRIKSRRQGAK